TGVRRGNEAQKGHEGHRRNQVNGSYGDDQAVIHFLAAFAHSNHNGGARDLLSRLACCNALVVSRYNRGGARSVEARGASCRRHYAGEQWFTAATRSRL